MNFLQRMFRKRRIRKETCSKGWKANVFDKRDYTYVAPAVSSLKKSVNLLHTLPDAKNWLYQGSLGSCVAHGIANQIYSEETVHNLLRAGVPISRLYLYYYARFLERYKPPTKDKGSYPRLAYAVLKKIGAPAETVCRYSIKQANKKPNNKARRFAFTRNNLIYRWIHKPKSDNIRKALNTNHVVTIGTQVTQAMLNYRTGSNNILKNPQKEKTQGGHYMAIIGYEKNHFIVANSWHGREIILLDESWIEWNRTTDLAVLEGLKK